MSPDALYAILSFLLAWKTVGHVAADVKDWRAKKALKAAPAPAVAPKPKEPTP